MDFSYIDPKFLSEAETSLKEYFQTIEIPIKYEKYTELIAINPTHENKLKNNIIILEQHIKELLLI